MSKVLESIIQNVKAYPDFCVLTDIGESNSFTYAQFDSYARKIAAKLVRSGVGARDFVSIELPKSKEFIAAIVATWLVGAAYVPLSPDYPEERLEYIRNDCGAKVNINAKFLKGIEGEAPFEGVTAVEDDAPALVIYTSGSTGKPKGVLHPRRSIDDAVERFNAYFDLPRGSAVALGAPFTFVVSVHDIFLPLTSCMAGCIVPFETMRDPILLAEFIETNQINHTFISPKMLKVFTPQGDCLKSVYTGSERVSNTYSEQFDLTVMYGQSECCGTLAFKVDKAYDNTPIGKPLVI